MIRIIDRALLVYPHAHPTLFVDDVALDIVGSAR